MTQYNQENQFKGHIKLELKNQGSFIVALILIFYIYFGLICNLLMFDEKGYPTNYPSLENGEILMWTFLNYIQMYFLPVLLLFGICFILTYKQDISQYGIKQALWLVPVILAISVIWHWSIFGFSIEPFNLLFSHWEGYAYILILFIINLSGAISAMKLKQYLYQKRQK